ncbi:MAG: hypothetical protein IT167_00450 [Bryobacterales bacterium]|nr:hypothetical protein [Bryobacterales bacterium]
MLCTPAISNIFPRRWFPPAPGANRPEGSPRYCGEYLDRFGNRITVHAVANPQQHGWKPAELFDRSVGYGIVEVERATRRITLANWPRHVDAAKPGAQPYPGWPVMNSNPLPPPRMTWWRGWWTNQTAKSSTRCASREGDSPRESSARAGTLRLIPGEGKPVRITGLTARLREKA